MWMSDTSQGPGWWQASDGLWYGPDTELQVAPGWTQGPSGEWIAPEALREDTAPGWWLGTDGTWYSPNSHPRAPESAPPVIDEPRVGADVGITGAGRQSVGPRVVPDGTPDTGGQDALTGEIAGCPNCGFEINAARPSSKNQGGIRCPNCGQSNLPYKWSWTTRRPAAAAAPAVPVPARASGQTPQQVKIPAPVPQAVARSADVYQRVNPCAIVALIFGLAIPIPLAAIVFGFIAHTQIDESGGYERGKALATWGIVLGFLVLIGWITLLIVLAHSASCDPSIQSC